MLHYTRGTFLTGSYGLFPFLDLLSVMADDRHTSTRNGSETAGGIRIPAQTSLWLAFGDVDNLEAAAGSQSVFTFGFVVSASLGRASDTFFSLGVTELNLGRGSDIAQIMGDAGYVVLGRGHDTAEIAGDVMELRAGRGHDDIFLDGYAGALYLGRGRDRVETEGSISSLKAGRGNDTIVFKNLDTIITGDSADDPVDKLDGGRGSGDTISIPDALGAFDIEVISGGIRLHDRFTGAAMDLTGFEKFTFEDQSFDIDELTDLLSSGTPNIFASGSTQNVSVNDPDPSLSVVWNRTAIESVINTDLPSGPTIASRAYAMVHTAIFDAFAAFDSEATRFAADDDRPGSANANATLRSEIEGGGFVGDAALQKAAMSFAAYFVLRELFPGQEALHRSVLEGRYGLDADDTSSLAARVGRDAAFDLIAQRATDGANQAGRYADATGYAPANSDPTNISDIARWTPENVPIDPEDGTPEQSFLTAHWGSVDGFALVQSGVPATKEDTQLAIALADPDITSRYADQDAAPEPFFTAGFETSVLDLDAKTITLGANSSFGAVGASVPVTKALIGEVINPAFISQAEVVLAYSAGLGQPGGDAGKVSAEFYEDGPATGFPPGTSMTFGEFVSAQQDLSLDQDALLFFALANSVFDAGIATWEAKTFFDYVRPVRAIRELGELGLIGTLGNDYKGDSGMVVEAYVPALGRTDMVLATEWTTYQTPGGDPSPPFAEFTSGHSAFSAAGAAALRAFSGSDEFGGSVFFPAGSTLFEPGETPEEDYAITWETFSDAADEAGLSRLYGGIHFEEGDFHGRALGQYVGENAYELALSYFDGTIA